MLFTVMLLVGGIVLSGLDSTNPANLENPVCGGRDNVVLLIIRYRTSS